MVGLIFRPFPGVKGRVPFDAALCELIFLILCRSQVDLKNIVSVKQFLTLLHN